MILLDTTVLVYAVGDEHHLRAPAVALITALRDGVIRAHTTPEVIQEFAHIRARRRGRDDALRLATAYAELLSPLNVVSAQHLSNGLGVWGATEAVGAFDAVLAAVAISVDATLVSADQGFASVPGLTWQDLSTATQLL